MAELVTWAKRTLGEEGDDAGAPPDVRVENLANLGEAARDQLRSWGKAREVDGNPPAWVADAATWERAKETVQVRWDQYEEPWAVVAHVYANMGGKLR